MTLTLVAVFIPVIFSPGRMGRLFEEFALALAEDLDFRICGYCLDTRYVFLFITF